MKKSKYLIAICFLSSTAFASVNKEVKKCNSYSKTTRIALSESLVRASQEIRQLRISGISESSSSLLSLKTERNEILDAVETEVVNHYNCLKKAGSLR